LLRDEPKELREDDPLLREELPNDGLLELREEPPKLGVLLREGAEDGTRLLELVGLDNRELLPNGDWLPMEGCPKFRLAPLGPFGLDPPLPRLPDGEPPDDPRLPLLPEGPRLPLDEPEGPRLPLLELEEPLRGELGPRLPLFDPGTPLPRLPLLEPDDPLRGVLGPRLLPAPGTPLLPPEPRLPLLPRPLPDCGIEGPVPADGFGGLLPGLRDDGCGCLLPGCGWVDGRLLDRSRLLELPRLVELRSRDDPLGSGCVLGNVADGVVLPSCPRRRELDEGRPRSMVDPVTCGCAPGGSCGA